MLQDTLKYGPTEVAQPESVHQTITLLGPLSPVLPDSLRQGIPPYANPHCKPTDSIFAQLELNQFFKTYNESQVIHLYKGKSAHLEKSIFTSSQLHTVTLKPTLRNDTGFNWLTGILIISFIIYTITQFLYPKRLKQIFRAAIARRYVNQLVREGGLFNERISIGLLFIFFTTATTFIFQGTRFILNIQLPHPELTFCAIFAGLLLYWILKVIMIKFMGFVFKNESAASEHNLTGLIFFEIIGLILLPISLPAVFQDPQLFSKIGLLIILIGLLINLIRGFLVGLYNTKFSFFYLILYLCTLEILPLVVVAKFLINN